MFASKHMWMPRNHLLANRRRHVTQLKCPILSTDICLEKNLKQHITQLFSYMIPLLGSHSFGSLICFFDQIPAQTLVRLLTIPRTATFTAQATKHAAQIPQIKTFTLFKR